MTPREDEGVALRKVDDIELGGGEAGGAAKLELAVMRIATMAAAIGAGRSNVMVISPSATGRSTRKPAWKLRFRTLAPNA